MEEKSQIEKWLEVTTEQRDRMIDAKVTASRVKGDMNLKIYNSMIAGYDSMIGELNESIRDYALKLK